MNEGDEDPTLPTRIIDVGNALDPPFLHKSNGERAPYLALSYCWGHSGNFRTTKESLLGNMREIPLNVLPATLRDAIIATRQLDFRYIWIDAICIVQDDEEDWNREAAKMQAIYASATITLSGLDSDDTTKGLFRTRKSRFTSPVQLSLRFPPTVTTGHHGDKSLRNYIISYFQSKRRRIFSSLVLSILGLGRSKSRF